MDAIAIVGPTASGKTDLAIQLAENLKTEIISADSMQFYKGMEIGTAIPPIEIRQRIPHHFVAFVPPNYEMNAGKFQHLAREQISKIKGMGKIPIIVGGSGLYLSALIDGLFEGPGRSEKIRNQIKQELLEKGYDCLFNKLKEIDPIYASKLTSPRDVVRIIRALEVYELTGIPFSEWHKNHYKHAKPLLVLQIALDWDRGLLYKRINTRVEEMVNSGWIEEVKNLITDGYENDIYRLKALGYKEVVNYIKGGQTLQEAIEHTQQYHRRYAKRQITWFRADKRVHWVPVNMNTKKDELIKCVLEHIERFQSTDVSSNQPCFLFRNL